MNAVSVTFEDVMAASERLRGHAILTPVLRSNDADELAGAIVAFKCENLQTCGAFKFRGAYNALAQFSPDQRRRGVVAFSSGNHAQAIARSAAMLGMPATIVIPSDAPAIKLAATRRHGADIILYDRLRQSRSSIAQEIASERGMTLIPSYDHPHVIAGQGTAAKEFFGQTAKLDVLVVPLGGGGLLSGSALAANALNPDCRIIGVEPEMADHALRSLKAGKIVNIDPPETIADGAKVTCLGSHTFPIVRKLVNESSWSQRGVSPPPRCLGGCSILRA